MVLEQVINEKFAAYNGDCCEVIPSFPDNSIGYSVYSPPFGADLYNFSSSDRDMSNARSYEDFLEHYAFLIGEIYRVTQPGRLTTVHCMDIPKGSDLFDYPGDIIRMHQKAGFIYHDRKIVWKEPLRVAMRTRSLGLRHSQIVKDSSLCKCAGGDYILTFRKPGDNKEPITHDLGILDYAGEEVIPEELLKFKTHKDPKTNKLSHWIWRRYASCVWHDIRIARVLPYRNAKDAEEEKHICPLQMDVIERCLELWSNPGDKVLTPFGGVGSEGYGALLKGRKPILIELKPSYFRQQVKNLQSIGAQETDAITALDIFDEEPLNEVME